MVMEEPEEKDEIRRGDESRSECYRSSTRSTRRRSSSSSSSNDRRTNRTISRRGRSSKHFGRNRIRRRETARKSSPKPMSTSSNNNRNIVTNGMSSGNSIATFVCYLCGRDNDSSSLTLIYTMANAEKEPFYPFVSSLLAPVGASRISPQGLVQICTSCHSSIRAMGSMESPCSTRATESPFAPPDASLIDAKESLSWSSLPVRKRLSRWSSSQEEQQERRKRRRESPFGPPQLKTARETVTSVRRRDGSNNAPRREIGLVRTSSTVVRTSSTVVRRESSCSSSRGVLRREVSDIRREPSTNIAMAKRESASAISKIRSNSCNTSLLRREVSSNVVRRSPSSDSSLVRGELSSSAVVRREPSTSSSCSSSSVVRTEVSSGNSGVTRRETSSTVVRRDPSSSSSSCSSGSLVRRDLSIRDSSSSLNRRESSSFKHSMKYGDTLSTISLLRQMRSTSTSRSSPKAHRLSPKSVVSQTIYSATKPINRVRTNERRSRVSPQREEIMRRQRLLSSRQQQQQRQQTMRNPLVQVDSQNPSAQFEGKKESCTKAANEPLNLSVSRAQQTVSVSEKRAERCMDSNRCFVCGLTDPSPEMRLNSKPSSSSPFFPFLRSLNGLHANLRADGSADVCLFCFHSLILQWQHDKSGDNQCYRINSFTCYVCAVVTYRRRMRALNVQDFPFLLSHSPSVDALRLDSGERVGVCLDCFHSLRAQFREGERYGIPVEKRQYNWMRITG